MVAGLDVMEGLWQGELAGAGTDFHLSGRFQEGWSFRSGFAFGCHGVF